jgi:hypothetical protein
MKLDAKAVALQGLGYKPKIVAVQGLLPTQIEEDEEENFSLGVRFLHSRYRRRRRDEDDDLLVAVLL